MTTHRLPRRPASAGEDATAPEVGGVSDSGKTWFLAYDIRQPHRLRQVHRCVRREGVALQYSGFAVTGDDQQLQKLLDTLKTCIDSRVDDVRAYHLPAKCQVWSLGRQNWADGFTLTGHGALSQLLTAHEDMGVGTLNDDNAVLTTPPTRSSDLGSR